MLAVTKSINQQGDHASGVVGAVVVGGHAQARDRTQKILGVDIGTDLAPKFRTSRAVFVGLKGRTIRRGAGLQAVARADPGSCVVTRFVEFHPKVIHFPG